MIQQAIVSPHTDIRPGLLRVELRVSAGTAMKPYASVTVSLSGRRRRSSSKR